MAAKQEQKKKYTGCRNCVCVWGGGGRGGLDSYFICIGVIKDIGSEKIISHCEKD